MFLVMLSCRFQRTYKIVEIPFKIPYYCRNPYIILSKLLFLLMQLEISVRYVNTTPSLFRFQLPIIKLDNVLC